MSAMELISHINEEEEREVEEALGKYNGGDRPLHKAIEDKASEAVVRALLEAYPNAIKEKDYDGYLPLHCAAENQASEAVVRALLEAYPDAVKEKDEDGCLPLHFAAARQASEAVVRALLEAYPEAAKDKDDDGKLPLDVAVANRAAEAVILGLLEAYPDAAKVKYNDKLPLPLQRAAENQASEAVILALLKANPNAAKDKYDDKNLLLHWAIVKQASEAVILALLEAYPDAAKENDEYDGFLPLHCAAIYEASSEAVVRALLEAYPDAAKEKDKAGCLPLHCVASNETSEAVVRLLLEAYPDAVKEKDRYNKLPLHYAAESKASEVVVRALLEAYPDAIKEKNEYGDLSLHIAIKYKASEAVILALLEAYPDAVKEKDNMDNSGELPLHHAADNQASEAVVRALLEAYPDAIKQTDNSGELPLHCAAKYQASEAVVRVLLEAYPNAIKEEDHGGSLPLHHAAKYQASEAVVRVLLEAYPNAVKEKEGEVYPDADAAKEKDDVRKLPLHYAAAKQASEAVILALLEADMPIRLDDGSPLDHAYSWTSCVAYDFKGATAAVRQILAPNGGGFFKHIHALAEEQDEKGRTALDISVPGTKQAIYELLLFCGRYELQLEPPEHVSATSIVLRAVDRDEMTNYSEIFDQKDEDGNGMLEGDEVDEVAQSIGLDAELILAGGVKSIDRERFVAVCKRQLGDGQRKVVIKLMQVEEQWERERSARKKHNFDSRYVVQELPTVPTDVIAEAVNARVGGLDQIAKQYLPQGIELGTRAIIMDAADRNLHQIYFQERPGLNAVRTILKQVFEAVEHLHEKKLMHGDLKMLNVVRFRRDNRLRLIDLDASAEIIPEEEDAYPSFAGAKFSSATLPPELFFELTTDSDREQFDAYWKGEGKGSQEKVAPMTDRRSGKSYVVKSFRIAEEKPVTDGLPYDLVEASENIDVWALGVLAFSLLTGKSLVPTTRDDDCDSGAGMRFLCRSSGVAEKLKKIDDAVAYDLVNQMLQREPSERPAVRTLLNHSFFHPKDATVEMKEEFRKAHEERQQMMLQLDSIDTKIDKVLHQLSVQFEVLGTLLRCIDKLAPKLICFMPGSLFMPPDAVGNKSWKFNIKKLCPKHWFNDTVRVFFIDPIRLTLAPTNASEDYPMGEGFELTFPKEWVVKAMPYVQLGLTTLKVAYVAGRLAGFPIPDAAGVIGEWIDGQLGALSGLADDAKDFLINQTEDPSFAEDLLKQLDENARMAISNQLDDIKPLVGIALSEKLKTPLEKSFKELDKLLHPMHGEHWREKCGLVLAGPSKADGRSEYVLEADKAEFMAMGATMLQTTEEVRPPPSPHPIGQSPAVPSPNAGDNQGVEIKMEGYLKKEKHTGGIIRDWHSRYFVLLVNGTLRYYKAKGSKDGTPIFSSNSKLLSVQEDVSDNRFTFLFEEEDDNYHVEAKTSDERNKWINACNEILNLQS